MLNLIIRRILQGIPVLLLVAVLCFILMAAAPGSFINPLTNPSMGPEDIQAIMHELGLDLPWYEQLFNWLGNLLKGDLGTSFLTKRPVLDMVLERVPATLMLTCTALVIAIIGGFIVGSLSATHPNTLVDSGARVFSVIGSSLPTFWLGLILVWVFAVKLHILPSGGMHSLKDTGNKFLDTLQHLILPAFTMALPQMVTFSRYVRGEMLDVLGEDYIRTAHGKGLPKRMVMMWHVLRNSLIPIVTLIGLSLPDLLSSAALVEVIYAWPGMGRLIVDSAFSRDYPVVLGAAILSTLAVIAGSLVSDILYGIVNPRVKFD